WPHSWNLSVINEDIQLGKVKIDRYATSQELNGQSHKPVGIGTFVHEFGHVLGLADHYNTMNPAASNMPGAWDVMCSGSYNGDQNCPATFTAFERHSLNWIKLTELNATTDTFVTVSPLEDKNAAYRISIPGKNNEYFIIENRQQKDWDQYVPGHGILVWHLDEDQDVWNTNSVNNDPSHPRVDIVEADRRSTVSGDSGDSFPGSNGVTAFNFNGWYDHNVFGFAFVDETEGGDACFLLSGNNYKLDNPQVNISDIRGRSAKASWTSVKYAKSYNVALMQNGKSLKSLSVEGNELEFDGLEPQTEYTAVVQAALADYVSDSVKVKFTTSELNFEER
ncbi:M6 family metalloprotease domain protein, partial [gut metagenome]